MFFSRQYISCYAFDFFSLWINCLKFLNLGIIFSSWLQCLRRLNKGWNKIIHWNYALTHWNQPKLSVICKGNSSSGRTNFSQVWWETYWCSNQSCSRGHQRVLWSCSFSRLSQGFPFPHLLSWIFTNILRRLATLEKRRKSLFPFVVFIFSDD